jgi:hypothetical protein
VSHQKPSAPDELIESRLIPCEHCGELAAQLIFIDDSSNENTLEQYAHKMRVQVSELNVPTWILGEPLSTPGFDTKTRILKVWPTHGVIQLKTANEFNAELDELLAGHCPGEDDSELDQDTATPQPQWQPISLLPTFTFMVDGMLQESIAQLSNLREVVTRPHVLDESTLNRIIDLYSAQLDDQQLFVEQFSRWQQDILSNAQAKEVKRLLKQSATLKNVNEEILQIAQRIVTAQFSALFPTRANHDKLSQH